MIIWILRHKTISLVISSISFVVLVSVSFYFNILPYNIFLEFVRNTTSKQEQKVIKDLEEERDKYRIESERSKALVENLEKDKQGLLTNLQTLQGNVVSLNVKIEELKGKIPKSLPKEKNEIIQAFSNYGITVRVRSCQSIP